MSRKPVPNETPLEYILDFCAEFSRRMILCGANIERIQMAVTRICHAYGLQDVSISMLSTFVTLSARDTAGGYAQRQCAVGPAGIHLQQLKQLNDLSYRVVTKKPFPKRLRTLLDEASEVKRDYAGWQVLLARLAAMTCLCIIFGGGLRELAAVLPVTALLHFLTLLASHSGMDRIIANALIMFVAASAALLFVLTGLSSRGPSILITVSMVVIPGIPLVNAVRNLLCGNEMNGILQIAKITIETVALAAGIYLSLLLFGRSGNMSEAVVETLDSPLLLILLSFVASFCFGAVFRIPLRDLLWAGLGGLLTRVALILLSSVLDNRIFYMTLAALVASLYAETLATVRRDPSTYFLYPAIIPLVPGNLFYYTIVGLYRHDAAMVASNAWDCLMALLGLSIGFAVSSTIANYVRRLRHRLLVKHSKPSEPVPEEEMV